MRSIIFTSLLMLAAGLAQAREFRVEGEFIVDLEGGYRLGPRLGCYERVWSPDELAKSPGQVIEGLRIRVFQDLARADHPAGAGVYMRVIMKAADQGQARDLGVSGTYYYDEFDCGTGYKPEFPFCYAYCGGGRMIFPRLDADEMVFTINQMQMRDETRQCATALDMAGGRDARFSYRVQRVDDTICEEM